MWEDAEGALPSETPGGPKPSCGSGAVVPVGAFIFILVVLRTCARYRSSLIEIAYVANEIIVSVRF